MTTNARDEKWSEWKPHGGGPQPITNGTIIEPKLRDGTHDLTAIAEDYRWQWDDLDRDSDIIAYRYKIKEPESGIADPDEEECLQLAYERMGDESVKVSVDELRGQSKSGGMKYDSDKPAMDLIPPYMEEEVGMVLAFGAHKYAPDNWRKVTPLRSRYLAAAQRHINALKKGEQMDPESGLHHAAHAVCCLMFLGEVELEPLK